MTELKPCPFCGGEATVQEWEGGYYIECLNPDCDVSPATADFDAEKEAIVAWNRRADDV